ncbi:MAG: hypothetical protein RLZZ413_1558, partial [Pseudomonadota bacterium]
MPAARRRDVIVDQDIGLTLGPVGGSHVPPCGAQGDFDLLGKVAQ